MADHVYELVLAVIENENYDIINEGGHFASDFANAASNIFKNMLVPDGAGGWAFRKEPFSIFTLGCQWKVSNSRPCFISCSDENPTGVSRSEACVLGRIYGLDEDDVKELLDMMNEAWFYMKQN